MQLKYNLYTGIEIADKKSAVLNSVHCRNVFFLPGTFRG
jgi:hypothetical protein